MRRPWSVGCLLCRNVRCAVNGCAHARVALLGWRVVVAACHTCRMHQHRAQLVDRRPVVGLITLRRRIARESDNEGESRVGQGRARGSDVIRV